MLEVKTVNEIFSILEENFGKTPPKREKIHLFDSQGRILAEDIFATEDSPRFSRSLVDGYAVIAGDTFGATVPLPVPLKKQTPIRMGKSSHLFLESGNSCYIPTGGELPDNADGVVMIEDTQDYQDEWIYITKPISPNGHICRKGEDCKIGYRLLERGKMITAKEIGLLASFGIVEIFVYQKQSITIFSSGDEIVPIDKTPVHAEIRDSNGHFLRHSIESLGFCHCRYEGILKDDVESMKEKVGEALKNSDLVLISGGSSAGDKDHTITVFSQLLQGKGNILSHGIAMKPGKPTIIAEIDGKPLIGLPGHPLSCMMVYQIFMKRLIEILANKQRDPLFYILGEMEENYPSNQGREEFLPVKLTQYHGKYSIYPLHGNSSQLRSIIQCDGYIHIKREQEGLVKGEVVTVYPF